MSGVVVNPCASHFVTVLGARVTLPGVPDREREEKEAVAGVNKEGLTLSQIKHPWS